MGIAILSNHSEFADNELYNECLANLPRDLRDAVQLAYGRLSAAERTREGAEQLLLALRCTHPPPEVLFSALRQLRDAVTDESKAAESFYNAMHRFFAGFELELDALIQR